MAMTIKNIMQVLECSEIYAQKIIGHAQGDEKMLLDLINAKLKERSTRAPVTIYEVV